MQLSLQLLSSILQGVEVWFKKHALELFQYSSVLFDNRIELNSDLKAIVEMTRSNISPQLHAKLLNCQATSCTGARQTGLGQFGAAVSATVVANVLCETIALFWNTLKVRLQWMFAQ